MRALDCAGSSIYWIMFFKHYTGLDYEELSLKLHVTLCIELDTVRTESTWSNRINENYRQIRKKH